jgi:DNA-binding NarL/FixJ family response regulator
MRAALDVPMVSVLAVADHAAFLGAAARALVRATSGVEVVAEAQSGEDALASAWRASADPRGATVDR